MHFCKNVLRINFIYNSHFFFLLKMHSHYIYSSQHPKVYKEYIFKPSQQNQTKFTLFVHCMHRPLNVIPLTKACLNL